MVAFYNTRHSNKSSIVEEQKFYACYSSINNLNDS